ncbi:uncharacterized protein LOC135378376 isoform X2 [Ornithodoros turicata]|uniref:uncharacterized protein LOC135378376 isoform X2 n=1 Tax=Ornithodoros turicata TaxID=34597 RepID=UPI00313937C0
MDLNPALQKLRIWFIDMSTDGDSYRDDERHSIASSAKQHTNYIKSRNGVLAIIEIVFNLAAFISVEAVAECRGDFACAPPACVNTYRFFAFVSFTSFLFTGAIFIARFLGVANRIPIREAYHKFTECSYLALTVLFYFIGNVFMIALHGNRIGYQCAAVFGVVAMATYSIQLAMYLGENRLLDIIPFCRRPGHSADSGVSSGQVNFGNSEKSWQLPPSIVVDSVATPDSPECLGPVILKQRKDSIDEPAPVHKEQQSNGHTAASEKSDSSSSEDSSDEDFHRVDLDDLQGRIRKHSEVPT